MRKTFGMNKHQKAAHRVGEQRVGRDEIPVLLAKAESADPEERLEAARYLCPCHVRQRIQPVWDALYRLLEDPYVRVRRAAWHTIEDGGSPGDPALDGIIERIQKAETDRQVRGFVQAVISRRGDGERDRVRLQALGRGPVRERGTCDFCGTRHVWVERDLETMIPTTTTSTRPAWVCEACLTARGKSCAPS